MGLPWVRRNAEDFDTRSLVGLATGHRDFRRRWSIKRLEGWVRVIDLFLFSNQLQSSYNRGPEGNMRDMLGAFHDCWIMGVLPCGLAKLEFLTIHAESNSLLRHVYFQISGLFVRYPSHWYGRSIMDEADLKLQKASPELIKDILRGISKILNHEVNQRKDVDRLVKVLDSFQEWPQLLDPHLSKLVPDLASALSSSLQQKNNEPDAGKDHADELSTQKAICEILYTVCKIRGSKVVTRFFSNEPKYIQTLLVALRVTLWIDQAQPEDCEERSTTSTWQERYIISLWLAHLVLTPFDLLSISPEKADIQLNEALTKSALPVIAAEAVALSVEQLFASSKESEAAKILLTRIALRSDMREYLLFDSLIRWILSSLTAPSSHEKLSNQMNQTYVHLGFLSLLAGLTISAEKAVIAPFLGQIYQTIYSIITQQTEAAQSILSSALTRKQAIKVLRSVVLQLESSPAPSELQIIGLQHESDEIIEVVVDHLLTSLADKDTPVRYAASKALSMITAKLEPAMAADIIEAVVESLEEQVLWDNQITGETLPSCAKENSVSGVFTRNLYAVDPLRWHGLVLTLSQMLLRRSPPPGQLGKILNALILALNFEQRSSVGKSVGVSVRDAACFGIWAIARQYSTEEIEAIDVSAIHTSKGGKVSPSMLQLLANELVVTATLDSAGNIRRGASAALQEMIGRHPDTIIEGIALVQAVDYHAVALRSRAAGHVALAASTLHNMYWSVIFAGLLGWRGVGSLDAQSRRETASAIGALSNGHLQTVLHGVRNKLRSTKKSQIEERHALLLALAAIVETLKSETLQITDDYPIWSRDGLGEIFDEVPHSQKDYASSALKSTLTAEAVCSLISAICHTSRFEKYLSRFLLASFDEQLTQRYDEVRWSLYDKSDLVRNKAVEALDELFYISSPQLQVSRATKWLADLNGKNLDSVKHGALMALGVAYRHTRERDIALTKEIPNKMLAQLSSINIYTRIWALRSLAASVLKTEGEYRVVTAKL